MLLKWFSYSTVNLSWWYKLWKSKKAISSIDLYTWFYSHQNINLTDEEAAQFPDPSEFRIAIVDEPQGILLRLEFLSGKFANTCLDVKLLVAIGIDAWPSSSDFPERVPLVHPDCLLYNMAAETVSLIKCRRHEQSQNCVNSSLFVGDVFSWFWYSVVSLANEGTSCRKHYFKSLWRHEYSQNNTWHFEVFRRRDWLT